jgi:integrase
MIVRIGGVNKVRAKGRIYYYHRRTGTRLPDDPRSPEFRDALARLEVSPSATDVKAGTLGALIVAYRASPEYARLADRTKHDYDLVFNYLKPLDRMPMVQFDTAAVIGIRDKAFAQRKRRFANHVLQVLGTVLGWGRLHKLAPASNPAHGIPKIPRPRDLPRANRPWSEAETDAVLETAQDGLRVAIALAVYAGMRGGDIVRVTWAAYDGSSLQWKQGKTGADVWVPCLPELKAILDAAARTATTIATQTNGTPMTEAGLRKAFRTLILRLLASGAVSPGLTLHGRRHTLGDMLLELGGDVEMVRAILGQKSLSAAQHYSVGASRKRAARAAVTLLANARRTVLQNRTGGPAKPRQ